MCFLRIIRDFQLILPDQLDFFYPSSVRRIWFVLAEWIYTLRLVYHHIKLLQTNIWNDVNLNTFLCNDKRMNSSFVCQFISPNPRAVSSHVCLFSTLHELIASSNVYIYVQLLHLKMQNKRIWFVSNLCL